MPTFSGCNQTNYSAGGGQTITLNPGVYCGGMNIGGGAKVTLNSGMYVLNGGGLTVNNGATLTGSGVTFFNTGQSGQTIAAIDIAGVVPITLSAQTSGTYQGILFIQDRNLSYATTNTFDNGSTSVLTGTLYFPSTGINYAGGTTQSYTAIIAKTLTFSNGASIKNDTTGAFTGLATHGTSLIN